MTFETIISDKRDGVGVITFNRPSVRNAINSQVAAELSQALADHEADPAIGAVVVTGNDKAFAAGADIAEMQPKTFAEVSREDFAGGDWQALSRCRKPIIAAVSGYALGAGCELAMMCDFILAADNARFGQPEIKLGAIPGAGGTQRLTRFVGKSKAMEMCLTGRLMDAEEAERCGLVSRVLPAGELLDDALATAAGIAALSGVAVPACKEAVNRAYETTLAEGVLFERRTFHGLFATEDQKEGMSAFVEKRAPDWRHR